MTYLHLSEDFRPTPFGQKDTLNYESSVFPGGEPHIRIEETCELEDVLITFRPTSFSDFGLLLVAVDALRRMGVFDISLFMPYFPGGRQDRVMIAGEALTVKVYADLINSMAFRRVHIMDPHSDVTPALLDDCNVLNNHNFVDEVIHLLVGKGIKNYSLVSPDNGANKKIKSLYKSLTILAGNYAEGKVDDVIFCDKTRDLATTKITGFEILSGDPKDKHCIIVDDICDGGGTTIGLAEELKKQGAKSVYLIITHGIFSKGTDIFDVFDGVYTTDSFCSTEISTDNIHVCSLDIHNT